MSKQTEIRIRVFELFVLVVQNDESGRSKARRSVDVVKSIVVVVEKNRWKKLTNSFVERVIHFCIRRPMRSVTVDSIYKRRRVTGHRGHKLFRKKWGCNLQRRRERERPRHNWNKSLTAFFPDSASCKRKMIFFSFNSKLSITLTHSHPELVQTWTGKNSCCWYIQL